MLKQKSTLLYFCWLVLVSVVFKQTFLFLEIHLVFFLPAEIFFVEYKTKRSVLIQRTLKLWWNKTGDFFSKVNLHKHKHERIFILIKSLLACFNLDSLIFPKLLEIETYIIDLNKLFKWMLCTVHYFQLD